MFKAAEDEKLRMRQQLISEGQHEPLWPAPYCDDCYESALAFVYQCRSYNEANKRVESFSEKAYIAWVVWHWYETRKNGQPIIIWKSRRLGVSWILRMLELWDAGLAMSSTQVAAPVYEGVGGSKQFVWRVWWLYDKLQLSHPGWNLPAPLPGGNPARQELDALILANGSKFKSVNLQRGSFQGSGTTRAVSEELPECSDPKAVFGQMGFVCQGMPGQPGGHVCAIGNTKAHTDWQELKAKSYVLPGWLKAPKGCDAWETAEGVRVLRIHYTCDPDKDSIWVAQVKVGVPADEWAREMEMDETIEDGIPVFGSYDDDYHCPLRFREQPIPLIPGSIYIGSLDCGQTLLPAFVLQQITPDAKQIHALLEVTSNGDESMEEFAPRILEVLRQQVPGIINQIMWHGDATVTTRNGANKKSAKDVALQFGINIKPVSNVFEIRRSGGAWVLTRVLDDQKPGFIIDGTRCPMLRMALMGKYKFHISTSGDNSGPGAVVMQPLKNMFSHVAEAWAYGAAVAQKMLSSQAATRRTMQTVVKGKRDNFKPPW